MKCWGWTGPPAEYSDPEFYYAEQDVRFQPRRGDLVEPGVLTPRAGAEDLSVPRGSSPVGATPPLERPGGQQMSSLRGWARRLGAPLHQGLTPLAL